MRNLYALLAGAVFSLAGISRAHAGNVTPDVANFTVSIDAPNNNVSFTNTSTIGSEPGPRRAYWNFGDGVIQMTGPLENTQHHYQVAGAYNVCLRIYRYYTNTGDSVLTAYICKTIAIPVVCHADFITLSVANNALLKYFIAQPSHNQNKKPVQVCWHFGDGRDTCITYPVSHTGIYGVNHTYAHPGTYNVCVNINYDGGCQAQNCHPVEVGHPDTCAADFERIISPNNNPLVAYFRALPQHNNNRKPSRICWTFGEGGRGDTCINYSETYTGQYIVSHTYLHPDNYPVCVHIQYFGGCEASRCKPIQVGRPDTCAADFERLPTPGTNPLLAYFKALPQHNNNRKPSRICWTFGEGGRGDTCINYSETYNGQYVISHLYLHPGQYPVCVNIRYFGGCEAGRCKPIQVGTPDSCRANFERIPSPNTNPLRAYFRALPWHSNNNKPARICWSFGDGQDTCITYTASYTGQYVVAHDYQHRGLYQVCVNILYFGGCEAHSCKPVQIGEPDSCSADFERAPIPGITPLTIGLRALPWNNNNRKPARICWTFGEGGRGDTCIEYSENYTGQYVVSHTYLHPGQYTVCVNIRYYGGCEASRCKPVVVPQPQTGCSVTLFEITPSITSLIRGFMAIPASTPASNKPVRVCWHFGDGQDTCIMVDTTMPHPNFTITHTYPGPGSYHACVNVLFQNGCMAYSCREVNIHGPAGICGGYMTDSLTGPRSYRFNGNSIHAPLDQVIAYHWTFGDGTSATGQTVTHTYNQGGNYQVCLYITTRMGCETRICKPLQVPGPNQPVLVLSPNPVVNILHVDFLSTRTEQVTIKIFNATGNMVRTFVRNVTAGPNNWTHDLGNLLPGLYSYVVQSPNQLASAIFVKL